MIVRITNSSLIWVCTVCVGILTLQGISNAECTYCEIWSACVFITEDVLNFWILQLFFPAQYFIMFYPPFFIFNIYELYPVVTAHCIGDLKNECIYIYELTTDIGSCSKWQKVCFFPNCKEKIPNSGNRNISPFCDILTALYLSKLYFCIPLISEPNICFFPFRRQKYFNIALVLQYEWLIIFTRPAKHALVL